MSRRVYINSACAVTNQPPFSEDWMVAPLAYDTNYARAVEPDMKEFIPAAEARRMCRVLKRAVASSMKAVAMASFDVPDAIITGTGMGCMENSEKFLIDMSKFGEQMLKPTLFMQSTHNTISSQIAILLKCHGYNMTYSSMASSFESALLDAWLKISAGRIANALVGSHDEVTPLTARLMEQLYRRCRLISEASAAFTLSADPRGALCSVGGLEILHRPDQETVRRAIIDIAGGTTVDLILDGRNGNPENDQCYDSLLRDLFPDALTGSYKNVFGENFSASAVGCYVGATILSRDSIPTFIAHDTPRPIDTVLVVNHSDNVDWTILLLRHL